MDRKNNINWGDWILTFIMLGVFWPVGLFLLFRQISNLGKPQPAKRHPYDIKREAEAAAHTVNPTTAGAGSTQKSGSTPQRNAKAASTQPSASTTRKKKKKVKPLVIPGERSGRVLSIVGISVSSVFALTLLVTMADILSYGWYSYYVSDLFVLSGFFAGGLVCLSAGTHRRRQAKRFRSYLSYIGKNQSVSLPALASAMGKRKRTVYRDLSDMLDMGVLPAGYIDVSSERLILTDAGIPDLSSQPEPEPTVASEEDENKLLIEIRAVNDAIPDQAMSEKIDRIGEITAKILDYQRSHPEKSSQLRSFLNYYLPTTLKVLRAYAQLDAQGIEGENITAAKKRIENMMDQVVHGFEKQLDRLFQDDAMDITSDVAVLENMLRQDGLSGASFGTAPSAPSFSSQSSKQSTDAPEDKQDDQGQGITLSL